MSSFLRPTFRLCTYILIAFFLNVSEGLSAEVLNVKGTKALLDISDLPDLKVGQNLQTRNAQGSLTSILKIRQIKSGRAVADVLKGRAIVGQKLTIPKADKRKNLKAPPTQSYWGALIGFNNNNLHYNSTVSGDLKLSGSSNSLKGFFQEDLSPQLTIRIGLGLESLVAKKATSKADISSFAFDAMIRTSLGGPNTFKPWLGAGLGFLIPTSKSVNFMDASKISARQHFQLGVGGDFFLDRKSFIPLEIIYSTSPKSAQFSTSQTLIRIGYGQKF